MEQVPNNANQGCPGTSSGQAGKGSACEGCPNQKLCAEKKPDESIPVIRNKLNTIKHKILVLSGKGGVGKSTVATQLALTLSSLGFEVGLLDVDICGPSVPTMLGVVGHEVHQSAQGWSPVYVDDLAVMSIGFLLNNPNDAVVWRGPRKNGLIKQFLLQVAWGDLDFLIIDTPPGTSDEHLSLVDYLGCTQQDAAIIVTTPQEVSLSDVRKEISFCHKTKINILGVIENMSGFVCPNCNCQSVIFAPTTGGAQKMCSQYKCKQCLMVVQLLAKIPLDPRLLQLIDKGKSVLQCQQGKVKQLYLQIAQKVAQHWKVQRQG